MKQLFVLPYACEVRFPVHISGLSSGGWCVDDVLEAVAVLKEVSVSDLALFVAVHKANLGHLLGRQGKPEVGKDLPEDLLADLEVLVAVEVLEEALGVKSVSSDDLLEGLNAPLDGFAVFGGWFFAGIDRLSPHVLHIDIVILL